MTKSPPPPSSAPERVTARWRKHEERRRRFLLHEAGYDMTKYGEFVTAWMNGAIEVHWKPVEKTSEESSVG